MAANPSLFFILFLTYCTCSYSFLFPSSFSFPSLSSNPISFSQSKCIKQQQVENLWKCQAIRGVDTYDSSFSLSEEMEETLVDLLTHEDMMNEVKKNAKARSASFTGRMFQPVPYSEETPYGMPNEMERYYHDKENYVVCNIPPFFMFKAKIFKPSRLCAIYQVEGREEFSFRKNRDGTQSAAIGDLEGSRSANANGPMKENAQVDAQKEQEEKVWKGMGDSLRQMMIDQTLEDDDDDEQFDFDSYLL